MAHSKPHGTCKGVRPCSDTPFPCYTTAPTWIEDWTDQEGGACKLSPRAQRRECGQGSCNAPRVLAAFFSPRPLLTVLCDCSVVVWHPKLPSHGAEQQRKHRRGYGICTGKEAGEWWAGSAPLACLLLWNTVQTAKAIKYEMNKTKSVIYCPEHDRSPWWVFKCLLLQFCF